MLFGNLLGRSSGRQWAQNVSVALRTGMFFAATVLTCGAAYADVYPSRMMRMIVPFAPGAAVDIVARLVANAIGEQTKQTVIVENKPGAASLIGADLVARSAPDGYTMLFTVDDTFTLLPLVSSGQMPEATKLLKPIVEVAKIINVMMAHTSITPTSLPELISYARNAPRPPIYASNASASAAQLAMETLKAQAKINLVHIPYNGNAPALQAIAGGEVQLLIIGYGSARNFIENGRLRPIVVAGPDREPGLPNIPTTAELGYPDVDVTTRLLIALPAKAPDEIVERLNNVVEEVLRKPATRSAIEARAVIVTNIGTSELAKIIERKTRINAEAVRISGAKME